MFFKRTYRPFFSEGEGGGKQDDPPKGLTEEDVRREAQKIADAIVAKKLKDMPTKEEMAAFKAWQDEQKKPEKSPELKAMEERLAQIEQEAAESKAKATKYERERAALAAGVTQDFVEFVAHKAGAMVTDDKTFDKALSEYLEANKQFKGQVKTGREMGDPPPQLDGVEKAFLAKNPDIKI